MTQPKLPEALVEALVQVLPAAGLSAEQLVSAFDQADSLVNAAPERGKTYVLFFSDSTVLTVMMAGSAGCELPPSGTAH